MKFVLHFLLFAFSISASAQHIVRGVTIDAESKEPLPFVNIALKRTNTGTTSEVDGRFRIIANISDTLVVTYVGYERRYVKVSSPGNPLLIELAVSTRELPTIEVTAEENPAFKIIRKAIDNRTRHDPENLAAFSYKAYHKFYATTEGAFNAPGDTTKLSRFFKSNHLFMNESFTERKFRKPNFDKEVVLGNRMSGVKDPFFAILATSFQPFSFYKNYISLIDKNYINPISRGSLVRYDFEIADTLVRQSDSTYVITFGPLPGKIFESLKGVLYINTNGYALEHVLAEPADPRLLTRIRIQQKYSFVQGHWFPEQLNTEFVLQQYKLAHHTVKYVQRSYLSSVEINPDIDKKEFGLLNLEFAAGANRQKEKFWQQVRLDSLTKKEQNTFLFHDTVSGKGLATLNSIVKFAEALSIGKFTLGNFYIPMENLFKANKYEAYRFGLALQTGERLSRFVVLDSYIGYGVKDKAMKFGAGIEFHIYPRKNLFVKFSYAEDILEPGNSNFIKSPITTGGGQTLRNLLSSRMDSIRQIKGQISVRPVKYTQVIGFVQQQKHNPAYPYSYQFTNVNTSQIFTVCEAGLQFRYAYQENYAQMGNSTIVTNFAYPQFNLVLSKGISFCEGQFDFTKIEMKVDYQFLVGAAGKTNVQLATGYLEGDAPYPYLFNGKGSQFNSSLFNGFLIPNYFQSMGVYEFTNDRYAYLFLIHHLGRIVGTKPKHFRPELSISQNIGIGSLRNNQAHESLTLQSMEKGYFESGITLSNILRFKYLNVIYIGFGAGAFYRYGKYAFDSPIDNLVFKVAVNFSL